MSTLTSLDWWVIGLYFAILLGIVLVASRRQKTSTDYFLAGRNIGFFAIGASIFASNIGSEHIVGLAGQGASTGLAMAHYELHAWIVVLLGLYTVAGGFRAVLYTDAAQALVLIVGSLAITAFGLYRLGGCRGPWRPRT